jgi:hypothetical protein
VKEDAIKAVGTVTRPKPKKTISVAKILPPAVIG